MSAVVIDIAGGTIKNIGSLVSTEYDMTVFPVGATLSYDSANKCISTAGTAAKPCLMTKNTTNIMSTNFGIRLIYSITGAGSIWGSRINASAFPIRIYVNSASIYCSSQYYGDNNGIIAIDGSINDTTFWFDLTAKTIMVKNNKTGKSVTFSTNISTTTMASYENGRLYLGCANYSDSPNYPGVCTFYAAVMAYAQEDFVNLSYLLKKDDNYYYMDLANDTIVDAGTDIEIAKTHAVSTLYSIYYGYLGEYKLIVLSAYTPVASCNILRNAEPHFFNKDDSDTLYDGVSADVDIEAATSKGKLLAAYNTAGIQDIGIKVHINANLKLDRSIEFGDYNLASIMKNGSDIAVQLNQTVKNAKSYGHALTESINIKGGPLTAIESDTPGNILCISSGYTKGTTWYEPEPLVINTINPDNNIMSALASECDSVNCIISARAEDGVLFADTYELDATKGLSDICIGAKSFLSIKLPDGVTDVSLPDWLSLSNNVITGIASRMGEFDLSVTINNIGTITSKITVEGLKRIS